MIKHRNRICIAVAFILVFGAAWLYSQFPQREVTATLNDAVAADTITRDPNVFNPDDVDFAKKKLIHHQLAVLIADKAKSDAVSAEVRQLADQVSSRESQRANMYAALLTSWNETYMNITDFPEVNGCNGYPTFPGMLPHLNVGEYRLSDGKNVDSKFFSLLIEHHTRAADLMEFEGERIGYSELLKLSEASQTEYELEISTLQAQQNTLL